MNKVILVVGGKLSQVSVEGMRKPLQNVSRADVVESCKSVHSFVGGGPMRPFFFLKGFMCPFL